MPGDLSCAGVDAVRVGIKDQLPAESEPERAAHDGLNTFTTDGFGYFNEVDMHLGTPASGRSTGRRTAPIASLR